MMDRIHMGQFYMPQVGPTTPRPAVQPGNAGAAKPAGASFREILDSKMLKFSSHAELRLKQRGIQLQQEQLTKLEQAVDKAASKGAKDSLLLMNDLAFIVNVPNRTVVTAMDGSSMRDNVFTQIDSAVIVS